MIREAAYAQSRPDFISKMSIALKEANETNYWISLLRDTKYPELETASIFLQQLDESVRMLASTVKTSKEKLKSQK